MSQSDAEANRLMEQQRLGDEPELNDDGEEIDQYDEEPVEDDWYEALCKCEHTREDHINYAESCCICDCEAFEEPA